MLLMISTHSPIEQKLPIFPWEVWGRRYPSPADSRASAQGVFSWSPFGMLCLDGWDMLGVAFLFGDPKGNPHTTIASWCWRQPTWAPATQARPNGRRAFRRLCLGRASPGKNPAVELSLFSVLQASQNPQAMCYIPNTEKITCMTQIKQAYPKLFERSSLLNVQCWKLSRKWKQNKRP